MARQPVLGAPREQLARLRARRGGDRHRRDRLPSRLRRHDRRGVRLVAPGARLRHRRGDREVAPRRSADPAAVGAARRHVPADERRAAAPAPRAARRVAGDALLHEQPGRGGGRAGERVRADRAAGPAGHHPGRRRAESRACHDRLVHRAGKGSRPGARRFGDARAESRGAERRRALAPAARGGRADRDGVVHLRDRLDPDAHARARRRDALVRAHAVGVHPRARLRRLLGARPHRPRAQSARLPRGRADRDGAVARRRRCRSTVRRSS